MIWYFVFIFTNVAINDVFATSSKQEYERCTSLTRKTCNKKFEIGKTFVDNYEACKMFCEHKARCKFIYHFTSKKEKNKQKSNNCKVYSSCKEFRTPTSNGATYSRDRTCPGKKLLY